jgi:hypothetical protein
MLPNRQRDGVGFVPAAPLILAAWWEATDDQKKARLRDHIHWASDNGSLVEVDKYLRSLPESEWHHEQ